MFRVLTVLPIYLAAFVLLPKTAFYDSFERAVLASQPLMVWHILAYGAAVVIGLAGACFIEYVLLPRDAGPGPLLRVLRAGCIGLLFTGAYQLFLFFNNEDLSVFILLVTPIFILAESAYELAEYVTYRVRRARARY